MTDNRVWMTNDTKLTYRVSNGVPNQLTMSLSPFQNDGARGLARRRSRRSSGRAAG